MTTFRSEALLLPHVASYARRRSFPFQKPEMPFFEYRVDLYGFSRKLDLTLAIELKLTKWQRALEQALLYRLCADLVFIALPRTSVGRVDTALLRSYGIGLLAVGTTGRCQELVTPLQSCIVRPYYRAEFIHELRNANGRS